MLAQVLSGAILGIDAYLVRVEVDLARGLPAMNVVGLPETSVREGRERVTAALVNSRFEVPPRRITIGLSPADVRKDGSAFDLPIAIGLLAATDVIEAAALENICMCGELGLDGEVRPVRGALALAQRCARDGVRTLILPSANCAEASVVENLDVRAARTLVEVVAHLRGSGELQRVIEVPRCEPASFAHDIDFSDVRGQEYARRALEVAAAGSHNALMIGPPGSGKSMLARRLPTILPPLTRDEALEVTCIHSVAGRLRPGQGLVQTRPFRAPHHTISDAGLVGGGGNPRPGEVSLAHNGVLFLDELPEFRRHVLESLRQPLEDGVVQLGRARITVAYPARFMLAAAMNPCPCGFYGDGRSKCTCHSGQIERYLARVSGPLLDRIDLHVDVRAVPASELGTHQLSESSAAIRERVCAARAIQTQRFRESVGVHANAHMRPREIRQFCRLDERGESILRGAVDRLGLSARAYYRVLRLARTIADLAGVEQIAPTHIAEAIQYRSLDRRMRLGDAS